MNSLKSILEECRIKALEGQRKKLENFLKQFELYQKEYSQIGTNVIGGRSIKFESSKRIKIQAHKNKNLQIFNI
jgi:hypothetical protein